MGIEARQVGERPRWWGARDRASVGADAMRQDGDQPRVGLSARGSSLRQYLGLSWMAA